MFPAPAGESRAAIRIRLARKARLFIKLVHQGQPLFANRARGESGILGMVDQGRPNVRNRLAGPGQTLEGSGVDGEAEQGNAAPGYL